MRNQIIAAAMLLAAAPAFAQVSSIESSNPAPARNPASKPGDPNKVRCEKQETTGTRLGARRVCLTVAQWEDKRREHREATEKVQRTVDQAKPD